MMSSIDVAAYPCSVKFCRATSMRRRRVASAWRTRSGLTDTRQRTKLTDNRSPTISRSSDQQSVQRGQVPMPSASIGRHEDDTVVTTVGLSNIPEAIRGLDTLTRPDYVDCCT